MTPVVGDVVQFDPETPYPFVLGIVTEVRAWGVLVDVIGPSERGKPPMVYPMRAIFADVHRIGPAACLYERVEHP